MYKNDLFIKTLNKLEEKLKLAITRAANVRMLYDMGRMDAANEQALGVETMTEQAVLLSRALPAYSAIPNAYKEVEKIIQDSIPVRIGFTEKGWFSLQIPLLLPKKMKGSTLYIQEFLYPAFREFFKYHEPVRYTDCVIIYRHIYDKQRPERKRRDHDNIEINMVTDIVALYVMPDDGPSVCNHYYCSASGDRERTEVYVVPKSDFQNWLNLEPKVPEDGWPIVEIKP